MPSITQGFLPSARFVNFYAYDGYMHSIDLLDAFHPQTILAYGMNGQDLPIQHGAPVRLRAISAPQANQVPSGAAFNKLLGTFLPD